MAESEEVRPTADIDTIKCIFLCEFHPVAGPKITTQIPENFITKETFATVNSYVIPRTQLQRSFLSVSLLGIKILGYPVRIDNRQYARNAFYFNLCFVFEPVTRTIVYEPVIRKLSEYLLSMELSSKLLSQNENPAQAERLKRLLTQIRSDINSKKMSMLQEGSSLIPLCVVPFYREVTTPFPYQAPVLLDEFHQYVQEQWDLTTLRIFPYVDGFNHIARIAALADVQLGLVQESIKHLIVLGVARILPVFQYSNVYRPCPALSNLAKSRDIQKRAVLKCSKSPLQLAHVSDIFRFYAGMNHGATLGESCVRFNPAAVNINEKRAVLFGLLEGLIRRVNKYPITITRNLFTGNIDNTAESYEEDNLSETYCNGTYNHHNKKPAKYSRNLPKQQKHAHYNGLKTLDEVCTGSGLSCQQMEEIMSRDQHVILLLR